MRDKSRVDYQFVRRLLLAFGKEVSMAIGDNNNVEDERGLTPINIVMPITLGQLESVREAVNVLLEMVEEEYMEDNRGISWRDWIKEQPGWEEAEV